MNARSMPRAPLIIIGGNLAVLDMHPDEHGALDRQNAGSDHVSAGCQRKIAGMTTLTVYINSTMPRVGQASRGNASHVRTSHTPARRQAYQRTYDKQTGSYQLGRWVSTDKRAYIDWSGYLPGGPQSGSFGLPATRQFTRPSVP
jgi:hypothetical protein